VIRRTKIAALIGVAATAALVSLYGDPRNGAVTHEEWARMLLRALNLQDALPAGATASQAFAILSWKDSLSFRADRYLSGGDVRVEGDGDARKVVPVKDVGEVTYPVAVVRKGDYRMRVQIEGSSQRPASAELTRVGELKAAGAFTVVPAATMGWVDAGITHLDPGAYTATVLLPRGTALQHVEVAPPCLAAIEPPGGWKATALLQTEHAAVTMVKAIDQEWELPPAATPVEVDASQFKTETTATMAAFGGSGASGLAVKAGPGGLRLVVFIELPEAGLYTISAFGFVGGGQSWSADACRKSVLCAAKDASASEAPQWRPVMTGDFAAGRHFFSVVMGPGAGLQRVRAEKKKDTPADYADTLRRLGFDVGPAGPMPRDRAREAMRFLEKRTAPLGESRCGDVVLPFAPGTRAGLEVAQIPGPAQAPGNAGPGQPTLGGPFVPPGQGGPSVISSPTPPASSPAPPPPPSPSPSPAPTPAPTAEPSPTPLPSPPTLPSPPLSSPTQPVSPSPGP
jgi:hypothetical protein